MTTNELDGEVDADSLVQHHDVQPLELDTASEDHPLKEALGDAEQRELQVDQSMAGEQFAFRYDDVAAFPREYIANCITACVRRGRYELVALGYEKDEVLDMSPAEVLDNAREDAGYYAWIEVVRTHPASQLPDAVIADNGIGLAPNEFRAVQNVGWSGAHQEGRVNGQFGQGVLSAFMGVGKYGKFIWETRSRLTDDSYAVVCRIDGFNDKDADRSDYGSTFRFPTLVDEARNLNWFETIEELSAVAPVDIKFKEYNADEELVAHRTEEFHASTLDSRFDDDQYYARFEDEFCVAATGPTVDYNGTRTFLGYQPIERNDGHGTPGSYKSRWNFDLRLKREDGCIAICECEDEDHTGQIPVEQAEYEAREDTDRLVSKDTLSEADGDHVQLPEPVDDKDRLKSGHRDFYKYVARQLYESYESDLSVLLSELADQGLDGLVGLDGAKSQLLDEGMRSLTRRRSTPEDVKQRLEDRYSLDDPGEEFVNVVSVVRETIELCPRNTYNITRQYNRNTTKVLDLIREMYDSDGTVFMAKSPNQDKAELAWALHDDNEVVKVSQYDRWENLFGWQKLKDLTLYNIEDEYGSDLPASILDKDRASDSGNSSSTSVGDGETPEDRTVKVRRGAGGQRQYNALSAEAIKKRLTTDGLSLSVGRDEFDHLVLYKTTEPHMADCGRHLTSDGAAYARVPEYVAEYLSPLDTVYESEQAFYEQLAEATFDSIALDDFLTDDDVVGCDDVPDGVSTGTVSTPDVDSDVLFYTSPNPSSERERLTEDPRLLQLFLRECYAVLDETLFEYDTLVITDVASVRDAWPAFNEEQGVVDDAPDVVGYRTPRQINRQALIDIDLDDLERKRDFPPEQFDREAPEWDLLKPTLTNDDKNERRRAVLAQLESAVDEGEPVFPSQRE
jgi:hypothetical protein